MSYQVIALKWRPKTFDRMIGQKHIGQTLVNALQNGRLPQALLFTGPRGTGKTSSARILAKSLRCLNSTDYTPCGTCSECIDITAGRSLDVIEIDGASNNGVDSIRELRESVSFRPTVGSKKVYIIDEVHMLSISAFNALLKTLEEPPDHVIFILATTEVHKIPKTILSRCHRFDFRKVSTKDVAEHLEFICTEEKVHFEKEALWAIARQGEGSVRDSFSFLDQVITYTGGQVTYDSVIESLGLTDRRLLTTILTDIVRTEPEMLLTHMEEIFKSGADVGVFAEDFLEQIKNFLIAKSTPKAKDFLDLPEAELQILTDISQDITEGQIHLLFDMMLETTQNLMRTQDQRTVLEVGLLKLCLYPKVMDTQPLVSNTNTPAAPMRARPNLNLNSSSAPTQSRPTAAQAIASRPNPSTAQAMASRPNPSTSMNQPAAKDTVKSSVPLNIKSQIAAVNTANHSNSSAATTSASAASAAKPQAKSSPAEGGIENAAAAIAREFSEANFDSNASYGSNSASSSGSGQSRTSSSNMTQRTSSPAAAQVSSYNDEKDEGYGLTEDQKKWHDFVAKVNRLNAKMGAVLQNCLYNVQGQSVWVGASEKMVFIKKDLDKPDFQKVLTNYIRTFLGPDFKLSLDAKSATPATANVANDKTAIKEQEDMTAEEKRRLIEKIHNSEAVQKLKKTFKDIEIVAIKEMKS